MGDRHVSGLSVPKDNRRDFPGGATLPATAKQRETIVQNARKGEVSLADVEGVERTR